jgi:hypothetical protein
MVLRFQYGMVSNQRFALVRNDQRNVVQTNVDNYNAQLQPRPDGLLHEWLQHPDRPGVQDRLRALRERPYYELYDLHTDPEEFTNLAGNISYAVVEQQLRAELEGWLQSLNDQPMQLELRVPPKIRASQ